VHRWRDGRTLAVLAIALLAIGCGRTSDSEASGQPSAGGADATSGSTSPAQASRQQPEGTERPQSSEEPLAETDPAESQAVREARTIMETYIKNLDGLSKALAQVRDAQLALYASQHVQRHYPKIVEAWESFGELDPELQQRVKAMYQERLAVLTEYFRSEIQRIEEATGITKIVVPLEDVPLFDTSGPGSETGSSEPRVPADGS